MTFWTLGSHDGFDAVTLCEKHALEATNLPCALFGLGPYATMAEAALELEAVTAVFGQGVTSFDFTSSEDGECGACEHDDLSIPTVVVLHEVIEGDQ